MGGAMWVKSTDDRKHYIVLDKIVRLSRAIDAKYWNCCFVDGVKIFVSADTVRKIVTKMDEARRDFTVWTRPA